MATYVTYKSVIAQAIADFNAVQGALNTKDSTIASAADGSSGTSLVPTNELPSKIRDYLVFPKGNLTITGAGETSVATAVVAGTNRTGYATVTVPKAVQSVSGATVSITSAGWVDTGTIGTVATGKLYSLSRKSGETGDTYTVMGGVETSGYIAKTDPRPTHVINAATFSGGAITVPTLKVGAISIAKTAEASQDSTVNLGSIGFADSMSDTDKTAYPYYFKIDMTAAGTSGTVSRAAVSATAGYTSAKTVSAAATKTVSVSQNSKTGYVKLAKATFELSGTNIIAKNTSANDSIGGSGYIKAGEIAYTLKSGATTPTVDSLTAPKVAITATPSGITTATSGSYYITVTGTPTNGSVKAKATVTEGYQTAGTKTSAASTTTPTVTGSGTKVYIKAGGVSHNLNVVGSVHDRDDSLSGDNKDTPFTFLTSAPASGDYLEIKATNNCSVSEGYQNASSDTTTSNSSFIPKAVLQYVKDSADGTNFIQVKTAGYLPAGVLGDIAGFDSTTPDYAELNAVTYTGPTHDATNKRFSWVGTTTVKSAGYLKAGASSTGTLTLSESTFSATSKTKTAPAITFSGLNMGGVTSGNGVTIKVTATSSAGVATVSTTSTAGYTEGATASKDVTIAGATKEYSIGIANATPSSANTTTIEVRTARLGSGEAVSGHNLGHAVNANAAPTGDYVTIKADGTATVSCSNVGILTNTIASGLNKNSSDTNYINAANNPTVGGASATVSIGTVAVGTATQFDAVSGTKQANTKTASSGNKTATISGSTTSLNDKYVCGTVSVSGTATANATASINGDASGDNVDSYVESLFKRMLGQAYTAVTSD